MSAKRTIQNCNCDYKLQIGFYFPIQIANYIILVYLPKYCFPCLKMFGVYIIGGVLFYGKIAKNWIYFFIKKKTGKYVMQKKWNDCEKPWKTNSIFYVYISLYFWFCLFDDNKGILNFKNPKGIIGSIQFFQLENSF